MCMNFTISFAQTSGDGSNRLCCARWRFLEYVTLCLWKCRFLAVVISTCMQPKHFVTGRQTWTFSLRWRLLLHTATRCWLSSLLWHCMRERVQRRSLILHQCCWFLFHLAAGLSTLQRLYFNKFIKGFN